jgi:hypothetical protein
MTIIKILKNNTLDTIPILNRDISPSESWEVPTHLWLELANDEEVILNIENGNIIVNNGDTDLSIDLGLKWITQFQPDSAGLSKRVIIENIEVKQEEEMLLSNYMEVSEQGCLDISGLLTILGE